jgi:hypothetical protein
MMEIDMEDKKSPVVIEGEKTQPKFVHWSEM